MKFPGALASVVGYLRGTGHADVAEELQRRWSLPLEDQQVDGPVHERQPGDPYSPVATPVIVDAVLRSEGFGKLANQLDREAREELENLVALLELTESMQPSERPADWPADMPFMPGTAEAAEPDDDPEAA